MIESHSQQVLHPPELQVYKQHRFLNKIHLEKYSDALIKKGVIRDPLTKKHFFSMGKWNLVFKTTDVHGIPLVVKIPKPQMLGLMDESYAVIEEEVALSRKVLKEYFWDMRVEVLDKDTNMFVTTSALLPKEGGHPIESRPLLRTDVLRSQELQRQLREIFWYMYALAIHEKRTVLDLVGWAHLWPALHYGLYHLFDKSPLLALSKQTREKVHGMMNKDALPIDLFRNVGFENVYLIMEHTSHGTSERLVLIDTSLSLQERQLRAQHKASFSPKEHFTIEMRTIMAKICLKAQLKYVELLLREIDGGLLHPPV